MGKPIYLGFAVLDLSKLIRYVTFYVELQHILVDKIYNYLIWILIVLYQV